MPASVPGWLRTAWLLLPLPPASPPPPLRAARPPLPPRLRPGHRVRCLPMRPLSLQTPLLLLAPESGLQSCGVHLAQLATQTPELAGGWCACRQWRHHTLKCWMVLARRRHVMCGMRDAVPSNAYGWGGLPMSSWITGEFSYHASFSMGGPSSLLGFCTLWCAAPHPSTTTPAMPGS
jgi:hypothetical protein